MLRVSQREEEVSQQLCLADQEVGQLRDALAELSHKLNMQLLYRDMVCVMVASLFTPLVRLLSFEVGFLESILIL